MRSICLLPGFIPGLLLLFSTVAGVRAEETNVSARAIPVARPATSMAAVLPPEKWRQVEQSVDRALGWLATQQLDDGSFPSLSVGQPAVTSLSVMAFLSKGHQPGVGPYGRQLNRAIDFVLSCQREEGLFSRMPPEPVFQFVAASQTASYNHAIAGLMLGEVYGDVTGERARKVRAAIVKAIAFTRNLQTRKKPYVVDKGGVRYVRLRDNESDSDLSITAWQLMFLRSARNAEFKVPQQYMLDGIAYVHRCWDPSEQMFDYIARGGVGQPAPSRGMTGAGIVSLCLAGEHDSATVRAAGDWLAAHPYESVGNVLGGYDRFYYSIFYCSQAAAQLGGHYWENIYPPMVEALLKAQSADGSFPLEPKQDDAPYGNDYTTAMAVLALTPAYQLLPVYQR